MSTVIENGVATTHLKPTTGGTGRYSDLPDKPKINDVTLSGNKTAADLGIYIDAYKDIKKKASFLYEVNYASLDYAAAKVWFSRHAPLAVGGCSALADNGLVGRNYDWKNDYQASFLVRTPNMQGHNAVIGMAAMSALTVPVVESREWREEYKYLPFMLLDGGNEHGMFCEMNVVPAKGNTKTTPLVSKRDSISALMLVRFILDNYSTVAEAVADIKDYVEVYFPDSLTDLGYELHFMIADSTSACIVLEIVNNAIVTVNSTLSTNFHLNGVTLNADGSVYTNADVADGNLPTSQGIESDGSGLERWNILNAASVPNVAAMKAAMESVYFTKAYTDLVNVWNSEFVGGDITVDTPADDAALLARIAEYREKYEQRSKDTALTWLTCHSCVYDMANLAVHVSVQEDDDEFEFSLNEESEDKEVFVAEYGVTTAQEIINAYNAGKVCFCQYNGNQYTFDRQDANFMYFCHQQGGTNYWLRVSIENDVWVSSATSLQESQYRKTAWSETPSNTNYPSEKLVKDSLDAKAAKTPIASSIPAGGMLPNVFYALGTITEDPNVSLATPADPNIYNEYQLQFAIGATVPSTITFPASVVFPSTPSWEANKTYQISIVNNLALVGSWSNS